MESIAQKRVEGQVKLLAAGEELYLILQESIRLFLI